MSNKLTKKDFDLLIERVLNESANPSTADIADALKVYEDEVKSSKKKTRALMRAMVFLKDKYPTLLNTEAKKIIEDAIQKNTPAQQQNTPPPQQQTQQQASAKIIGDDTPPLENPLDFAGSELTKPKQGEADKDYADLLDALQNALSAAGITKDELSYVAGLHENKRLNEDTGKLEIEDIEKLFNLKTGLATNIGNTKSDPLDVAEKINATLDDYISKAVEIKLPDEKIRTFMNVKRQFAKILARNQGLEPEELSGIPRYEIPRSAQLDVPSPGATRAKIDPRMVQAFDAFFGSTIGFVERIKKISKFSNDFVNNKSIELKDLANGMPLLKIMSNITRQFNATSGGTEMEATLALIAGGGKIGGSNGAGDFLDESGNQYSAKWVQGDSTIKQAAFKKVLANDPAGRHEIRYVIGIKKGSGNQVAAVSSNLLQTTAIDIYTAKFVYENKATVAKTNRWQKSSIDYEYTGSAGEFTSYDSANNPIYTWKVDTNYDRVPSEYQTKEDRLYKVPNISENWIRDALNAESSKAIDIVAKMGDPVATITFVDADTKMISEQFKEYTEIPKNDAIRYMSNINKKLQIISEYTTDFANDESLSSAFGISDNYNTLKDDMKRLFNAVDKTGDISKGVGLAENKKKSKKDLDILIEQVILKRLLEK